MSTCATFVSDYFRARVDYELLVSAVERRIGFETEHFGNVRLFGSAENHLVRGHNLFRADVLHYGYLHLLFEFDVYE